MTPRFLSLAKIPAEYWIHKSFCMYKCLFQKISNFHSISKFEPKVDNVLILSLIESTHPTPNYFQMVETYSFSFRNVCLQTGIILHVSLFPHSLFKKSYFLRILYCNNFSIFHLFFPFQLLLRIYYLSLHLVKITSFLVNWRSLFLFPIYPL